MEIEAESLFQVGLSKRKESCGVAAGEANQCVNDEGKVDYKFYPFATVLRLRVLQIVFGITFLIIGGVAFIEEQGELNLGLGIPAGASTILASAASIHTTRGFGGYRPSKCLPGSPLRFLGPSAKIAVPLSILWLISCSFLAALAVQAAKTLTVTNLHWPVVGGGGEMQADPADLIALASLELCLALITLLVIGVLLRIDCKYDPD